MFDELLFATAVILGATFVRLARRREGAGRGYLVAISLVLACTLAAAISQSRFLSVVAMSMTTLVVIVPWALEHGARTAFARGRLRLAVAMAGMRALLMPGAGLGRQQEILRGLAVLEKDGVDEALRHFHQLVDDAEDGGELALINEQLVSMMFYGQRWDEGIALYEARFQPRYAAMRPALALGLLRAYGESNRLDSAAVLLRALEEGPIGSDPRAVGLLCQARLTFLAYAGAAETVETALTQTRREVLGMSEASSALFRGIAHLRAGDPRQAREHWETVPKLAGSSEDRVVSASRRAMAALEGFGPTDVTDLDPDLRRYVVAVAQRLQTFLSAAPKVRKVLPRFGTPLLIAAIVVGYALGLLVDRGGYGFVDLGAMVPALWRAGDWFRLASGAWTTGDPISALLQVYALWMAAPLFERVHGVGRLLLASIGGAAVGLLAAAGLEPDAVTVIAGGNLVAAAVVAGTIWTLLPVRSPRFPARARRAMLLPLVFLLLALGLSLVPDLLSLRTPPAAFAGAVAFGVFVAMLPGRSGRWLGWLGAAAALVHLVGLVFAVTSASAARDELAEPGSWTAATGPLPQVFEPVTESRDNAALRLPIVEGAVDSVALAGEASVQLLAEPAGTDDDEAEEPVLLRRAPALRNELTVVQGVDVPPSLAQALSERGVELSQLRVFALRGNAQTVALSIERTRGQTRIALVASPPEALEHAPGVYAAALADELTGSR